MAGNTHKDRLLAFVGSLAQGVSRAEPADPSDPAMAAWADGFNRCIELIAERARAALAEGS